MQNALYSCHILMKLELSLRIFEKYLNIKFHSNPFSGNRIVPCGRTDGQTDRRTLGHTGIHDEPNCPVCSLRLRLETKY